MSAFNVPEEFYYTKDHEWAQVDENVVTVGITEFAQDTLCEVVYVELPEEGQKVTQPHPCDPHRSRRKPAATCHRPRAERATSIGFASRHTRNPVERVGRSSGGVVRGARKADRRGRKTAIDQQPLISL